MLKRDLFLCPYQAVLAKPKTIPCPLAEAVQAHTSQCSNQKEASRSPAASQGSTTRSALLSPEKESWPQAGNSHSGSLPPQVQSRVWTSPYAFRSENENSPCAKKPSELPPHQYLPALPFYLMITSVCLKTTKWNQNKINPKPHRQAFSNLGDCPSVTCESHFTRNQGCLLGCVVLHINFTFTFALFN